MLLDELLLTYTQARSLRPRSVEQLRVSINSYARFVGRRPATKDFRRELLNRFIDWLLANRSPDTAWNKRKDLLTLWSFAWEEGLYRTRPERIKKVRKPRRDPDAWTKAELRQIVLATGDMPGVMRNGIPFSLFFKALVLVLYSTGLRISAAVQLRNRIDANGTIYADAATQKHNQHQQLTLQPAAIEACRAIRPHLNSSDPRLLPWPYTRDRVGRYWRRLLAHAGIEDHRRNGTQKIRRSAASWLELESPGSATRFLGHSTPDLALRHYLDPKIIYAAASRTPPPF